MTFPNELSLSPARGDAVGTAPAFLLSLPFVNTQCRHLPGNSCHFLSLFPPAALGSEAAPPWEGEGRGWTRRGGPQGRRCPAGSQLGVGTLHGDMPGGDCLPGLRCWSSKRRKLHYCTLYSIVYYRIMV